MEATGLGRRRLLCLSHRGAQGRGRDGGNGGVWEGRPTIADEQGKEMDRGGEEAIRETEKQNNDQLVKKLESR